MPYTEWGLYTDYTTELRLPFEIGFPSLSLKELAKVS
jgi:hypothetical protein